jgi:hypothetical protein
MNRTKRPAADALNRRHFIRNAASAASALALPAAVPDYRRRTRFHSPSTRCIVHADL